MRTRSPTVIPLLAILMMALYATGGIGLGRVMQPTGRYHGGPDTRRPEPQEIEPGAIESNPFVDGVNDASAAEDASEEPEAASEPSPAAVSSPR